MASYKEIHSLLVDGRLDARVLVAIWDVANDIRQESDQTSNHANRYRWAAQALRDPEEKVWGVLAGVLVANKGASVAAILDAPDDAIKDAVTNLVDLFAGVEGA